MKIILDNFNYRGCHFDHFECELPQIKNVEDIPEERITAYVTESLDEYFKDEEA